MDAPPPTQRQRFYPRFSLLTIFLVMALIACGITIWQLWQEVGPLRNENRQMQAELGRLNIDDPMKVYLIALPTFVEDTWKWRIYLPEGAQYSLNGFSGKLPDRPDFVNNWYGQRKLGIATTWWRDECLSGEFTLEAKLTNVEGNWLLVTQGIKHKNGNTYMIASEYQLDEDWLSDRPTRNSNTFPQISAGRQSSFKPGEPIPLLKLLDSSKSGFALWIAL